MSKDNLPDLDSREGIIAFLKEMNTRVVYQEDFTFLHRDGTVRKEDIIKFRPKAFGKSTRETIVQTLGLKSKEDCEELNRILGH